MEYDFRLWDKAIDKFSDNIKNFVDVCLRNDFKAQWMFIALIIIVFGTILTLAILNKITETTIGTLLGAAIGYTIGRQGNNKNKRD
jgi:hypothetical protein